MDAPPRRSVTICILHATLAGVSRILDRLSLQPGEKGREKRAGHPRAYKALALVSLVALVLQTSLLFISLFEEPLPYRIADPGTAAIDSPEFLRVLSAFTGGGLYGNNRVDVLTNGEAFYQAELEAIRTARKFVHLECYVFRDGRVTDRLLRELEGRARAGVEVRLVVDAIGSTRFPDSGFARLREAGGRVAWYHPVRWYTWPRLNNRTHREIVVVDGTVAFAGGAGFADQWLYPDGREPRWRDTMVRIEGEAATGLDATFSENWLESSGDMLVNPRFFPFRAGPASTAALVVTSSPTSGRSAAARMLVQSLVAKATRSVHITTPYFLPDKSLRAELVKAVRERHVSVRILVPGVKSDHLLTRTSSRALYGDLLLGGARIFEYQPSMIHAKTLLVDGKFAVAGSTNLDARSFGLNDEVNVALPDRAVTERLERDFEKDLESSREVHYEEWKKRSLVEKAGEWLGWLFEKQQ